MFNRDVSELTAAAHHNNNQGKSIFHIIIFNIILRFYRYGLDAFTFAPGSNYLTVTLGKLDALMTGLNLHSTSVLEDCMSMSSPISSPVYKEPSVAFDDPFVSSVPTSQGSSPISEFDRSSIKRPSRVYSSHRAPKTMDLRKSPPFSPISVPTSPLFPPTIPNAPVKHPDDLDNFEAADAQDHADDFASDLLSQCLGDTEFDDDWNDSDDDTSPIATNRTNDELKAPQDNVMLFNSSGSFHPSSSSPAQASLPSTSSRLRKVYVLYSPVKKQPVQKKHYSPQGLLRNMDAWGIEPIDPENTNDILDFFCNLGNLRNLMKYRDKRFDKQPGWIPGYQLVLKDWVPQNAIEDIPSKEAVLLLEDKVSSLFLLPARPFVHRPH